MTTQEAWEKQTKVIERYRTDQPQLLINRNRRTEAEIFKEIGIWNLPINRPLGYIRLLPSDFVVEEKSSDGKISKINEFSQNINSVKKFENDNNLYANLIKIGIPTEVAIKRIANDLGFNINKIGYAGLKDADAITAQRISLSGSKLSVEDVLKRKIPNLYLTDFYFDKGSVSIGGLIGNIFTIIVRTKEEIAPDTLAVKLEQIKKYGILNYFQSQRFGGLRLSSHLLGKAILQGNYEETIRIYLLKENPDDIPLIADLRKKAKAAFPDWQEIEKIFSELPYTFYNELKIIGYLTVEPNNYIGALIDLKNQTQLWLYAYASWLYNRYLSTYSKTKGVISERFTLLLSDHPEDEVIYKEYLEEDETENFKQYLKPFKFIRLKRRSIPARILPTDIDYKIFNRGVVIKFTLPKACYATTFLSNIFTLTQGLPIPDWVNKEEIDPKELLGKGDIKKLKEIFKDSWYSKIDQAVNLDNPVSS